MTPTQAIELILEANESSQGGEVFVLKMPVIRIGDLAESMIELMTEKYDDLTHTNIECIGLRPGEKQFEELMTLDEQISVIEKENMYIIPSIFKFRNVEEHKILVDLTMNPVNKDTIKNWLTQENLI